MPNTTPDGIYYPDQTVQVSPLEAVFAQVANSVQTAFSNARNELAPQQITDSGWTLTGLNAASGFSGIADSQGRTTGIKGGLRMWGPLVELRFRVTKGTGTITADASGNIGDVTCANIATSTFRPAGTVYAQFDAGPGSGSGACRIGTDGSIVLTDFYPKATITAGQQIQIDAMYFVG